MKKNLLLLAITILTATLFASAQKIPAGNDHWITDSNATGETLELPEGFFGEGSLPYSGFIRYKGDPRSGVTYDTSARRESPVSVPGTTSIKVVELYLKTVNPIDVSFKDGTTSPCDIYVEVSPSVPSKGTMTIEKRSWSSNLTVVPSYKIRCDRGNAFGGISTVVRDMGTPIMQAYLREKARTANENIFAGNGTMADEIFASLAPADKDGVYGAQFNSKDNGWALENNLFRTLSNKNPVKIDSSNEITYCDPDNCAQTFENGRWICHCVQPTTCPGCQIPFAPK